MSSIFDETSRTLPSGAKLPHGCIGILILYAYECALLEQSTEEFYIYRLVNLSTKKNIIFSRRKRQIDYREIDSIVGRIKHSGIAGIARCEADRPYKKSITYMKCREILYAVFNEVMPNEGYTIRKEQIDLASQVLHGIYDRNAVLAEAEVGTGKTHAYLIAAILAKRGRLNDFWNNGYFPEMSYIEVANMPIVIATSSIALQRAIISDYIPELSRMLIDRGIIRIPLTAVLRKGREHYVCDKYLYSFYKNECNAKTREILKEMIKPLASIDLAEYKDLSMFIKRQICVPPRCSEQCQYRKTCRYLCYMDNAMEPHIDIQVTNHNYLIADALHRANGKRSLLPNYQMIVIDEAHKLLQAARSMYGTELSSGDIPDVIDFLKTVRFKNSEPIRELGILAKKLIVVNQQLFGKLTESIMYDTDDDKERYSVQVNGDSWSYLRKIYTIADKLHSILNISIVNERHQNRKTQILWQLKRIGEQADTLSEYKGHISWLEKQPDNAFSLCAIPKSLEDHLFTDLWSKRMPTIFTSGTLSAGGDFSHTKQVLGLDKLGNKVSEVSKPSPFNHRDNTLLYISEDTPFPDGKDGNYVTAITDEIEKLVRASDGHSAVLFTSYDTMGRVYAALSKREIPFPLMRLERGGSSAIERFKRTKGGVLFASGALWEGIDIPGDTLSLLIIVKLPFQVPDPIGEYEQTLYKDFDEYKSKVVVPEMLIKLKQGFGRLIRTETDTGCVAILDSRANVRGAYRKRVLNTLPKCRVTSRIADVERFIKAKKAPDYFVNHSCMQQCG